MPKTAPIRSQRLHGRQFADERPPLEHSLRAQRERDRHYSRQSFWYRRDADAHRSQKQELQFLPAQ
jgi:hypothetical protein